MDARILKIKNALDPSLSLANADRLGKFDLIAKPKSRDLKIGAICIRFYFLAFSISKVSLPLIAINVGRLH